MKSNEVDWSVGRTVGLLVSWSFARSLGRCVACSLAWLVRGMFSRSVGGTGTSFSRDSMISFIEGLGKKKVAAHEDTCTLFACQEDNLVGCRAKLL